MAFSIEIRQANSPLRLANSTPWDKNEIIAQIKQHLPTQKAIKNGQAFTPPDGTELRENVDRILVISNGQPCGIVLDITPESINEANYFVYTAKKFTAMAEEVGTEGEQDTAIGSYQWELPAMEFEGLAESLVYGTENCPKNELLTFIQMTMEFAQCGVDATIIPQSRLILLNGPPGTGKTTLCKAVAQRMAIRSQNRYKRTLLVEVNSHSLFSNGKLIQKLFTRIEELAERPDWLVFVLIDEVESLTMGREASFAGNDPTDSVRAVNAVLTQLDKMKKHSNVFILCTSNIERALDPAFIDRVGLVRNIGHPSEDATVEILSSCVNEMKRVGLLTMPVTEQDEQWESSKIREIAKRAVLRELSGRTLRKLPAQAYSTARQTKQSTDTLQLATFLDCLKARVEQQQVKVPVQSEEKPKPTDAMNMQDMVDELAQIRKNTANIPPRPTVWYGGGPATNGSVYCG